MRLQRGVHLLLILSLLLTACAPGPSPTPAPTPATARPTPTPTTSPLPVGDRVPEEPLRPELFHLNQVGYLPDYPKIALIAGTQGEMFKVVATATGRSVYADRLGPGIVDEETLETVRPADFSALTTPGEYVLVVPGVGRSPAFRIGPEVFDSLARDAIRSYDVLRRLAPAAWERLTARAPLRNQPETTLDVSGGWPDAGDYGKYVPTAGITLGELLLLWELFPDRVRSLTLDLPGESGGLPDYLRVLKEELDWLLKMQRADGAVYHKVTPEQFGPFSRSEADLGGTFYVYDVSTPDTALFAAVMARAARVFQPYQPAYAARLRAAAERAWTYLEQQPRPILPPDRGTGGYFYADDASQRLWAAAELFRTTGQPRYRTAVEAALRATTPSIGPLTWADTRTMALLTYLFTPDADPTLQSAIRQALRTWADEMVAWVSSPTNPYRVSLSVYSWASNKAALDNAVLLLVASAVTPQRSYREAALDQLHYVLGRNPLAKSYVIGYGHNSVRHPHNRIMVLHDRLVPGVIVGGPNKDAQDGRAPAGLGPRSYIDATEAYSVNENSIEYNAPLVFVAAFFRTAP